MYWVNGILLNEIESLESYPNAYLLDSDELAFYLANPQASLEEIQNLALTVHVATLDELKAVKLNELQTAAQQAETAGYYDSDFNVTIRIAQSDLLAWNNRLTLINEAERLNIPVGDQKFVDINNHVHTFTLQNFRILMVKMGGYADSLWDKLATKSEAATDCETKETLDLIQW